MEPLPIGPSGVSVDLAVHPRRQTPLRESAPRTQAGQWVGTPAAGRLERLSFGAAVGQQSPLCWPAEGVS